MGVHTAFEIQHPGTRLAVWLRRPELSPRPGRFRLLFVLFLLRFVPHLLLRTIKQRNRQLFPHLFVLLAEIGYPQFPALFLPLGQVNDEGGNNRNGDDNGRDFGQKQAILSK